ncbi:MAG: 50S ribosomal protein L11 methyltransferase [Rhodobacteraceae bacterium]|nr:50S ribosomal protein L11 methyltransferase [Paracoccaceae bacterium]
MPTYTALTTLSDEEAAHRLGAALEALDPAPSGVGVFELEDGSGLWEVGGYFDDAPDDIALTLLAAAHLARPFTISEVPETDWVAHVRRALHPIEAGRFFIHGSHDADKVPPGVEPLLIEAAMAFGTGHHGTTLGCLLALEDLAGSVPPPARVLDLGCGTAVLAMAAARIWPGAEVIASDIDTIAVEVALANAAANGLAGRLHCLEAAGLDHPDLQAAAPFALIFANILRGPLLDLAPDIARATAPGGRVILSGLLTTQAPDILAAYRAEGLLEIAHREIGEWSTLTLAAPV